MSNKNNSKKKNKKIIIVIIAFLLLLLITSCNSNFFGKIGDIFDNSSSYKIKKDNDTLEEEKNTLLKFIKANGETSIDNTYKIEFISKLNTKKYNCTTSNAKIATCSVKGNFVKVYPKKKGKVTIYVSAKLNGKKYIGTHALKIYESKRGIKLSSVSGKIDLSEQNTVNVMYTLNNIKGKVIVESSNQRVAKGIAKNNVLTIKAFKGGRAVITLKVNYKGKEYKANYELTVYDNKKANKNEKYININKNKNETKDDISTLRKIEILGFKIIKIESNNFKSNVNYDTMSVTLNIEKTSSESTVRYFLSNQNEKEKEIKDISNINLTEGDNIVKIVVTSKSKKNSTSYFLTIHKPMRTIIIDNVSKILIEDGTIDIPYYIKDDKTIVKDYEIDEVFASINPEFNGDLKIKKGKVSITPSQMDLGKSYSLTLYYLDKTSTLNFIVDKRDYFAKFNSDKYDLVYLENPIDQYIVVNTNMFSYDDNVSIEHLTNGIRLRNSIGYLDITSSNMDLITFNPVNVSEYGVELLTTLYNQGNAVINMSGKIYGQEIESSKALVNITNKFQVTIDAVDGFFNSFTNKYSLLLDRDEIVKLSDYVAYLESKEECKYYKLDSYNTSIDGLGDSYNLNDEIVNKNITLYAIYKKESKELEINNERVMYLTDVDLFHNEEYYKKYKKDKIIYPGATGSHTMYIENATNNTIVINSITLTEDTMCNEDGCINMGYILRYSNSDSIYHYFYGQNNSYKVLNLDSNAVRNNYDDLFSNELTMLPENDNPIVLKPKAKNNVEIDLLWKWLNINDELDTKIGKIKDDVDYKITIKVDYSIINNCSN